MPLIDNGQLLCFNQKITGTNNTLRFKELAALEPQKRCDL
jgi:CBS domain-containing protein